MPAEGRENPLLKKGNSDAFFREKYLTKNTDHHTCGYDKDPDCFHGSLEPPSGLYDPHDHIDAYSPDSNYVADLIDHYKRACLRHEQSRRDHGKYKNA